MIVNSSHIAEAHYDPEAKHLDVTFSNGATYRYHGVPGEKAKAFFAAESHGKFLHSEIKPHHPSTLQPKGKEEKA